MIIKQLEQAEARIVQVVNAEHDVLADLLRRRADDPGSSSPEDHK
jgi:hypothetical protein